MIAGPRIFNSFTSESFVYSKENGEAFKDRKWGGIQG